VNDNYERLFFALWPDETVRTELSSAFDAVSGLPEKSRRVVSSNLHLTLHFLGNISSADVHCFLQQAEKVRGPGFELNLNTMGHFKKPKVLWLGCKTLPPALHQLHAQLADLIQPCGFYQESRPYQPHITMARKIPEPLEDKHVIDIRWPVDRFALIQSHGVDTGVDYRVKAMYPLNR
jgi:2'-5' RNA ligase